jgi:transposase
MTTADPLPGDMPGLRAAALALIAERDELLRRVERMRQIIRQFQRAQFGRRSERLDADQLQLALEEREIASAQTQAPAEKQATTPRPRSELGQRKSLPTHLPRIEVVIEPETTSCRCCGGAMHVIGEEESERLDVIPAQHRILVSRRPKHACRACADGRTKSGYFWSIARDDSAWCGDTGPPGVVYTYAPGRAAEHAAITPYQANSRGSAALGETV